MEPDILKVHMGLTIEAQNGGLFVSRGEGCHPDRRIPSFELIFVRKGVLSIQEEDRVFQVGGGQSLLLYPGRRHSGTAPFSSDLSFYWVHFMLQNRSTASTSPELTLSQHVSLSRPDHITELFRRFLDDQESGVLDTTAANLLVLLMLWEVAQTRPSTVTHESSSRRLASRADAYIRTNFHRPLSPSSIAEILGCNANYLSRIFHEVYDRTLIDTIHQCRLRHARQLLLDDTRNIDEIARACGFTDTGYFRRLFRRYEGMTPLAFRQLYSRFHTNTH